MAVGLLSCGGLVVWPDYTPLWPDVWTGLHALHQRTPFVHVAGTTLVVWQGHGLRLSRHSHQQTYAQAQSTTHASRRTVLEGCRGYQDQTV
jgi:hypothetical protein